MKSDHIEKSSSRVEPVAVVGLGLRFPGGANDEGSFWKLLVNECDCIVDVPAERWDVGKFYHPDKDHPGSTRLRQGGFLQQPFDTFDPEVFGISPREACIMDPQQRWLLESTWEAIEDAGWTLDSIRGNRAGVFVGGFTLDNMLVQLSPLARECVVAQTSTSSTMVMLSNRISYTFDLAGPSLTLDTACSSSLVAIHQAAQSIWRGESDWAIAGGVNAMLIPDFSIAMTKGQFLSSDSRSRSFGAGGDGYGRGEGAGVLILKPLSAAIRDGDRIHGTILGTGCNQDGRTSAITVPNEDAQIELMHRVSHEAGVKPSEVGYVEAHGTGTPTGDPIEFNAIRAVFATDGQKTFLGSVKSNIGHLEAAAGVAGFLKALLTVKYGQIPRSLHSETINPEIEIEGSGVEVPQSLTPFPECDGPRIAAINSFGYGGTNANVIVASYSAKDSESVRVEVKDPANNFGLCAHLSAQSWEAIPRLGERYANFLKECPEVSLEDFIHTLSNHRTHLDKRVSLMIRGRDDLIEKLSGVAKSGQWQEHASATAERDLRTAFIYTGMGPQWWAMGRRIYETNGLYRRAIEKCDRIFGAISGWSLRDEFLRSESASRVASTEVAQPLNFALQYALTEVLSDCGIEPDVVVGHSVGEVASAAISGALSLEDALLVSYHRSRLQQQTARLAGGMLAVGMNEVEALKLIKDSPEVSIAAINAPNAVTLSGDLGELNVLASILDQRSIFNRRLKVEIAYHSSFMDQLEGAVMESLADIRPRLPKIPLFSTVTGAQLSDELMDAGYWWRNIRQPVRFMSAINEIAAEGYNRLIEMGPHPALGGSIRECLLVANSSALVFPTLNRKIDDDAALLDSLSNLHCSGLPVRWSRLLPAGHFVRIPHYPWQYQSLRHESQLKREYLSGRGQHPFLAENMRGANPGFKVDLNANHFPWLVDHRIRETVLFPGAGFIECGFAICREVRPADSFSIENFSFTRFLEWSEDSLKRLHTTYDSKSGKIGIYSQVGDDEPIWTQHAEARMLPMSVRESMDPIEVESCVNELEYLIELDAFYDQLDAMGLHYGSSFRRIESLSHDGNSFVAKLRPSEDFRYSIHPAVLDSAFQAVFAPLLKPGETSAPALPIGVERIDLFSHGRSVCVVKGELVEQTLFGIKANLFLYDTDGSCVAALWGASFQEFNEVNSDDAGASNKLYELKWEEVPRTVPAQSVKESRWLLVGDFSDVGTELTELAMSQGIMVDWVLPGEGFAVEDSIITFDISDRDGWRSFHQAVTHSYDRVVFLDSLVRGDVVYDKELQLIATLIHMASAWMSQLKEIPQLTVLTRATVAVKAKDSLVNLCGSSLHGLCYVIGNEIPGVCVRQIDLPETGVLGAILFESIVDPADFECIAIREEARFVEQLASVSSRVLAQTELSCAGTRLVLEACPEEGIDAIYYRHEERRAPAGAELEIEVQATGLNFKDLLKAQGKLDPLAMADTYFESAIGLECVGRVVRVGPEHSDLKVGEQCVFAVKEGAFASYITFEPDYWLHIPSVLKPEETLVIVPYMTALRALEDIALVSKGERVLIHGACGAVGLAAIEISLSSGAEVFATAGTEAKRDWLRSIGVTHVYDSRSLAFSDEIRSDTGGDGVDVVLNSIAGEALRQSLQLLAPHGRFVEIGKKDIVEDQELGMSVFNKSIQFAAIDLDRILRDKPELSKNLIGRIYDGFESGRFRPMPITSFPVSETQDAFYFLSRSRQIGKVIVSFTGESLTAYSTLARPIASPQGAYLITGGTRGLGLELAKLLSRDGAGAIYLASRSENLSPEAAAAVERMQASGTQVEAVSCDVSCEASVRRLQASIATGAYPLRGIMHSAMVLDDAMLSGVTEEQLQCVLAPKVKGALVLNEVFSEEALDYFISLSSISSLMGNAGQAAYVAANSVLDGFSYYRHGLGLPATTVNLGVVRDVGVVARSGGAMADNLEEAGLLSMDADCIYEGLRIAINSDRPQVGLFGVRWDALLERFPVLNSCQRFKDFSSASGEGDALVDETSMAALSDEEKKTLIKGVVRSSLASILRLPSNSIEDSRSLNQLGMDSLMGMELSINLTRGLGFPVSTNDLSSQLNLDQLAVNLIRKINQNS